ncbi:MAG: hypothetical protein KKC28_14925 [Verrucomicrobia bacterium]|nr:hypothetical protein [Verrucomicrobiota bacterium]
MLAIKGYYRQGHIELAEPIPSDIQSAELKIVVIPSQDSGKSAIPADAYHVRCHTSEKEFKQIGLTAFFDTDDDVHVDWEKYFGLK